MVVGRVVVAPTTPFDADGVVDTEGLARQVSWLKEQGITALIAGGTTGEFAGMTSVERLTVLKATISEALAAQKD